MKIGRLLGLFLLLGTEFEWVCGKEVISSFMEDVMATFRLKSPTIVYDSDEAPELCYRKTWVLCLSSRDKERERDPQSLVEDNSKSDEPTNKEGRDKVNHNLMLEGAIKCIYRFRKLLNCSRVNSKPHHEMYLSIQR